MQKKPSHIKHYLRAKSAEGLKALMIDNNVKKQYYFDYQIIHDGTYWYAWFEWDIDSMIPGVNDETNDQGQGIR